QLIDVCAYVLAGCGSICAFLRALHSEVSLNESGEVEAGRAALVLITLHDDSGCLAWHGVDEGLAIGEDALHLHVLEQLSIELRRGFILAGGRRREDQRDDQADDDPGLHASSLLESGRHNCPASASAARREPTTRHGHHSIARNQAGRHAPPRDQCRPVPMWSLLHSSGLSGSIEMTTPGLCRKAACVRQTGGRRPSLQESWRHPVNPKTAGALARIEAGSNLATR